MLASGQQYSSAKDSSTWLTTPRAARLPRPMPPSMNMVGQYIRDLSFENPGAPGSIMAGGGNPAFNVSISVGVKKQADDIYAVELTLNAKANREDRGAVQCRAGLWRRVPPQERAGSQLSQLLMIECPRLIFPFARQVLASITQQGGFPPLMMEPVDFAAIYRQNLAKLAAKQGAAPLAAPHGDGRQAELICIHAMTTRPRTSAGAFSLRGDVVAAASDIGISGPDRHRRPAWRPASHAPQIHPPAAATAAAPAGAPRTMRVAMASAPDIRVSAISARLTCLPPISSR